MTTYNRILRVFEEIANAHFQVEQFGHGSPADIPEGMNYPYIWVVPDPVTINLATRSDRMQLKVLFADLLHEDKSNEADILSDQKQTACDIVAQLQLEAYHDRFEVDDNVRLEPIIESVTTDAVAGWLMTITLRMPYTSNACQVPSSLSPSDEQGCPSVGVYDSTGVLIANVPAGSSYTVTNSNVRNSAGTLLASLRAQQHVTLPDKTLSNSDDSYTSPIVQGVDKEIQDVIITRYDGVNMAAQPYQTTMVSTQIPRIYAYPPPTGQTTEYRTRDDRWVQVNLFSNVPSVGYLIPIDPDDRTKLLGNNTFGNTNRFTDSLGGQTYANNYIIDHGTALGWFRTIVSSLASWNAYVDYGLTMSEAGFSDYFLPSINHYLSVMHVDDPGIAPFNFRRNDDSLISSTTLQPLSTHCYRINVSTQRWHQTAQTKASISGSIFYAMYCRKHF